MSLFWIVYENKRREVVIREATTLLYARLYLSLEGYRGEFVEAIELDEKTAKKVPKKMIGKVFSQAEAAALLKKIG